MISVSQDNYYFQEEFNKLEKVNLIDQNQSNGPNEEQFAVIRSIASYLDIDTFVSLSTTSIRYSNMNRLQYRNEKVNHKLLRYIDKHSDADTIRYTFERLSLDDIYYIIELFSICDIKVFTMAVQYSRLYIVKHIITKVLDKIEEVQLYDAISLSFKNPVEVYHYIKRYKKIEDELLYSQCLNTGNDKLLIYLETKQLDHSKGYHKYINRIGSEYAMSSYQKLMINTKYTCLELYINSLKKYTDTYMPHTIKAISKYQLSSEQYISVQHRVREAYELLRIKHTGIQQYYKNRFNDIIAPHHIKLNYNVLSNPSIEFIEYVNNCPKGMTIVIGSMEMLKILSGIDLSKFNIRCISSNAFKYLNTKGIICKYDRLDLLSAISLIDMI